LLKTLYQLNKEMMLWSLDLLLKRLCLTKLLFDVSENQVTMLCHT
jgi:hypothetical protein